MSQIILPTKTLQDQRLERLIRMFNNRNKNRTIDFTKLKWSIYDNLFYTYLDLKDYQITFEPCANGFDIGIYKKGDNDIAVIVDKMCTNCEGKEMYLENVIDRAIHTAEYLIGKYNIG